MSEWAFFQHVDGPAPTGVAFTAVPVLRKRTKGGEEIIELQHLRVAGATLEDVRARAVAQDDFDRDRALKRDRNLREAAERRTKKATAA